MNALHSVPMKAAIYSRGKEFAIAIAQRQRAKSVWRSNDPSKVINVRGLGDKDGSTLSKTIRNSTSFQNSSLCMKEELRTKATSTPVGTVGNSSGRGAESFFKARRSSNSA